MTLAYSVVILLAVLGASIASNTVLVRWGRLVLIFSVAVLGLAAWLVSTRYEFFPTEYLDYRAYVFYRTIFIAFSLFAIALSCLALSFKRVHQWLRIAVSFVVGVVIAWGGGFVT
jgi:hypothetical protein